MDYSKGDLVTDSKISFVHDAALYAGTDFYAYLVYYKIYPVSGTANFARLLEDRTKLSTSPTVNQLVGLGYQQFSVSGNDGTSPSTRNLEIQVGSDGTKVSLDFADFLTAETATSQPLLLFNDSKAASPYLYRSLSLGDTMSFATLRSETKVRVDMSSLTTSDELEANAYEVNVFIAAYGLSPTLAEVYSPPVPWGVIRTIQPF